MTGELLDVARSETLRIHHSPTVTTQRVPRPGGQN